MGSPGPQHTCPRCGYDVSGVVPKWSEQCPLEGTCSECGLVFAWVDIFRPERLYPAWSFEHARTKRPSKFLRTVGLSLRPGRFWHEMSISAPIRVASLIAFLALVAALTHALVVSLAVWKLYDTWLKYGRVRLQVSRLQYWSELAWTVCDPYRSDGPMTTGLWLLSSPYTRLLLVWGVLVPFPYLLLANTMRRVKCRRLHLVRAWVYFVPVVMTAATLVSVLGVVWWQFPPLPWVWQHQHRLEIITIVLTVGLGAWYAAWWWRFTHTYLRLPQPGLVVALLLLVSFMATLAVASVADQQLIDTAGGWLNSIMR